MIIKVEESSLPIIVQKLNYMIIFKKTLILIILVILVKNTKVNKVDTEERNTKKLRRKKELTASSIKTVAQPLSLVLIVT
jgi:hypothetical protein